MTASRAGFRPRPLGGECGERLDFEKNEQYSPLPSGERPADRPDPTGEGLP